jgi:ACR3 family arsenite efflux pump ArsB
MIELELQQLYSRYVNSVAVLIVPALLVLIYGELVKRNIRDDIKKALQNKKSQ